MAENVEIRGAFWAGYKRVGLEPGEFERRKGSKSTKNTASGLLATGLSVALVLGTTVSGVRLWALFSQEAEHADNSAGICEDNNDYQGTCLCFTDDYGKTPGTCVAS